MNILLIEDEANACIGLTVLLKKEKCDVDFAESAEKAIEYLKRKTYDLLLLDIMLLRGPSLFKVPLSEIGKELLVRLRNKELGELKTNENVPILIITAVADLEINMALREINNVQIVHKPIVPEDVLEKINTFIKGGEK